VVEESDFEWPEMDLSVSPVQIGVGYQDENNDEEPLQFL